MFLKQNFLNFPLCLKLKEKFFIHSIAFTDAVHNIEAGASEKVLKSINENIFALESEWKKAFYSCPSAFAFTPIFLCLNSIDKVLFYLYCISSLSLFLWKCTKVEFMRFI